MKFSHIVSREDQYQTARARAEIAVLTRQACIFLEYLTIRIVNKRREA